MKEGNSMKAATPAGIRPTKCSGENSYLRRPFANPSLNFFPSADSFVSLLRNRQRRQPAAGSLFTQGTVLLMQPRSAAVFIWDAAVKVTFQKFNISDLNFK